MIELKRSGAIYFHCYHSMKLLGLTLLLLSCSSLPEKIDNLNNGQIHSIGHGGPGIQSFLNAMSYNTLSGFRKALSNEDLDGVEMDVQMSSNGKLVLFHDQELDITNCEGKV